ncbi:MAG: BUG/TctC family periplasmic protein, partial [uncultured Craurococcus sp.]
DPPPCPGRPAGPARPRPRAGQLSGPADSLPRALPAWRRHRHLGAHRRRGHAGRARPAHRHREPWRRRRADRHRGRGQGAAGRLHPALHHHHPCADAGGDAALPLRPGGGFRAHRPARHHLDPVLRRAEGAGRDQDHGAVHRLGARAGPLLRLLRAGQHRPCLRADAGGGGEARDDACLLSRRDADAAGHAGRQHPWRLPQHGGGGGDDEGRAHPGLGRERGPPRALHARGAEPQGAGLLRPLRLQRLLRPAGPGADAAAGARPADRGLPGGGNEVGDAAAAAGDRHHPELPGPGRLPGADRAQPARMDRDLGAAEPQHRGL